MHHLERVKNNLRHHVYRYKCNIIIISNSYSPHNINYRKTKYLVQQDLWFDFEIVTQSKINIRLVHPERRAKQFPYKIPTAGKSLYVGGSVG